MVSQHTYSHYKTAQIRKLNLCGFGLRLYTKTLPQLKSVICSVSLFFYTNPFQKSTGI